MFTKIFSPVILLALLAALVIPGVSFAQGDLQIAPNIFPVPRPGTSIFGQNHAYTVVFRGNGEAVISARIALTNNSENPLSLVEFRMPLRLQTSEVASYQVIKEDRPCLRYNTQSSISPNISPTCVEFGEPDYYQFYGQNKYQKGKVELSGDTLKVTLPTPLQPEKSGAFFVYFRGVGLTSRNLFGAYNYSFETLRVNDSIQNLQVGITTDSDLVLKGATGSVDYRFEDQSRSLSSLAESSAKASPAIDNFYGQIGYGTIVKTASSLAPLETYQVEGSYAANKFTLYAKEILIGFLVVAAVIVITFFAGKKFFGRGNRKSKDSSSSRLKSPFVISFSTSLGGAVLVGLYTGALLLVGKVFENMPYGWEYQQFVWLLVAVISFAVYGFLIISPAVLIGLKKGIAWGFATLGLTILWLVLLTFIIFVVFFFGKTPDYPVYPLYNTGAVEKVDTPALQ